MPAISVSLSASSVVVIATSLESLGECRNDRPADRSRRVEPAQRSQKFVGLLSFVLAKMDEGERLQRVEREAAGAVRQLGLRLPATPIGAPAGLVSGLPQPALGDALGLVEPPTIGVSLVEAKIDCELGRGRIQGL